MTTLHSARETLKQGLLRNVSQICALGFGRFVRSNDQYLRGLGGGRAAEVQHYLDGTYDP